MAALYVGAGRVVAAGRNVGRLDLRALTPKVLRLADLREAMVAAEHADSLNDVVIAP